MVIVTSVLAFIVIRFRMYNTYNRQSFHRPPELCCCCDNKSQNDMHFDHDDGIKHSLNNIMLFLVAGHMSVHEHI